MTTFNVNLNVEKSFDYNELRNNLYDVYGIHHMTVTLFQDKSVLFETAEFKSFIDLLTMLEEEYPDNNYNVWKEVKNEEL